MQQLMTFYGKLKFACLFTILFISSSLLQGSQVDILYSSDSDIAGFQFNVNGVTVQSASGGDAASSGFMVTAGSVTLGFSFTGAT